MTLGNDVSEQFSGSEVMRSSSLDLALWISRGEARMMTRHDRLVDRAGCLAGSCVLGRVCTIDALYQEGKKNLKIMLAMKLSRTSRRS